MSSRRVVSSFAAAAAMVVATGWYSVVAFPLTASTAGALLPAPPASAARAAVPPLAVAPHAVGVQAQAPTRDRRPGEAAPPTARERELEAQLQAGQQNRDAYFLLAALQERRAAYRELEATLAAARQAFPGDPAVYILSAQTYNRLGRFDDAIAMLKQVTAVESANPQGHQILATFYWEKAFKDAALHTPQRLEYIRAGIDATDRALALDPDYADALVYKNILLRMEANLDGANRERLIAQADELRNRALELQRAGANRQRMAFATAQQSGAAPPPPPPPPPAPQVSQAPAQYPAPPPAPLPEFVDGVRPRRVGGSIKPPVKIRNVAPVYPPIAQAAGVHGVVIIEAVIDTSGNVFNARVLRGVPLLDEAALEAVSGWQFQPVLVDGVPTPVIMTVTVNFTVDR